MPLTKFQSEVLAIIVGNRSEESHFASRLVLNASEETTRFSDDFDMFHDAIVNLDRHSVRDVVALEAAGYEVGKIRARALNPIEMKMEWITISDKAEEKIIKLADTQLDMPIGVASVNEKGEPGWIGADPALSIHYGSLRGCWPVISPLDV